MISLDQARHIISEAVQPREAEAVSLPESRGLVLAADVLADATYPGADRSMMDGYAIRDGDDAERFRVVGEVQAGAVPQNTISAGECVRIYTGAELPAGAGRVIPQEEIERDGDWMKPLRTPAQTFVRRRGAEAQTGDVVLAKGSRLGAADLAILAQVGIVEVPVHRRASVCHIATGNELVDPGAPLPPGCIRDTNSTLISALVAECGATLVDQQRCGDDLHQLHRWAESSHADLLLISGGASVGEYDFGARALRESGYTIHFDKVNLRPGKPLTFATKGSQSAFVIPGNPVSHFVCFQVAIRLAIERLHAVEPLWSFVSVELGGETPLRGDPRETYWPAKASVADGRIVVTPRRWSSSGDTFSLAGTNALLRVAADVSPGALVPALLLDLAR